MNKQEHLLVILGEESVEISKEASKALRFGLDDHYPGEESISNRQRISDEINDFIGVMELCIAEGLIEIPNRTKIEDKKLKVAKYMQYARDHGTLKD